MSSASSYDVLFFIAAGAVGLGALIVFLWAWFGDRSRGRRRCPKCWYDMSQTPGVVCSECGRDARMEKRLFRTRRRKRWAALAVLFVLGSAALAFTPKVKRDGWWSVMPNTVLVFALQWEWDVWAFRELEGRIQEAHFRKPASRFVEPLDERRLSILIEAALNTLESSDDAEHQIQAQLVLRMLMERGREPPLRLVDFLVGSVERSQGPEYFMSDVFALELPEVCNWLSGHGDRICDALLDKLQVIDNESAARRYVELAMSYRSPEDRRDVIGELIPCMQSERCALAVWEAYRVEVDGYGAPITAEQDPLRGDFERYAAPSTANTPDPMREDVARIHRFSSWILAERSHVRSLGKTGLCILAARNREAVVGMLQDAIRNAALETSRERFERTLRLVRLPARDTVYLWKKSHAEQRASIERLWDIDPEFGSLVLRTYATKERPWFLFEAHLDWLNARSEPSFSTAFLEHVSSTALYGSDCVFVAKLAAQLDEVSAEMIKVVERLLSHPSVDVRDAATEALEKMKARIDSKVNSVEIVDDQ